jgi:hypothetical protein
MPNFTQTLYSIKMIGVSKLISLIFIFITSISFSQNDLELANLKDSVKSVRTREYMFNGEKFNFWNGQNDLVIYNRKGMDSTLCSFSTAAVRGRVADSTVYNYLDGKKIEARTYMWGALRSYTTYTYKKSKLLEMSFFKIDSSCFLIMNYEHSSSGEFKVLTYTPEDTLTRKIIHYNSQGDISKEEQYKNGNLDYHRDFTYDKSRLLVNYHYKSDDPKNGSESHKSYKYYFDKKGNWISKKEFEGGRLVFKVDRKIKYYE